LLCGGGVAGDFVVSLGLEVKILWEVTKKCGFFMGRCERIKKGDEVKSGFSKNRI